MSNPLSGGAEHDDAEVIHCFRAHAGGDGIVEKDAAGSRSSSRCSSRSSSRKSHNPYAEVVVDFSRKAAADSNGNDAPLVHRRNNEKKDGPLALTNVQNQQEAMQSSMSSGDSSFFDPTSGTIVERPNQPVDEAASEGSVQITAPALLGLLAASTAQDVPCPPGFVFSVYDADVSHHYTIPSEQVFVTQGAIRHVEYHSKYGVQTRFRFQLCRKFLAGRCTAGRDCAYIHCTALPRATHVHVNETLMNTPIHEFSSGVPIVNTMGYEVLPGGLTIPVYSPNSTQNPPQSIPSDQLLKTKGSLAAYAAQQQLVMIPTQQVIAVMIPGQSQPVLICQPTSVPALPAPQPGIVMRARHCAHFQFRRMCNLGSECNFIHSLVPYIQQRGEGAATVSAPQIQPNSNIGGLPVGLPSFSGNSPTPQSGPFGGAAGVLAGTSGFHQGLTMANNGAARFQQFPQLTRPAYSQGPAQPASFVPVQQTQYPPLPGPPMPQWPWTQQLPPNWHA